jgi:leader peptidase (prepilin peptidase)/N-methyltransferase
VTSDLIAGVVAALTFVVGGSVAAIAAVEDARTGRLRNKWTATIAAAAVVGLTTAAVVGGELFRLAAMLVGAALFCFPFLVVHVLVPAGVGFGDVKLTAGLGLYLGWIEPTLSVAAILVATIAFVVVTVMTGAARREARPFGPALVFGAAVATAVSVLW